MERIGRRRNLGALLVFLAAICLLGVGCGLHPPSDRSDQRLQVSLRPTAAVTPPTTLPSADLASTATARSTPPASSAPPASEAPPPPPLPILVYLDPGHGGVDSGGTGYTDDGQAVDEKTYTLALAQRTARDLASDGIGVVLSRTDDSLPGSQPSDYTADGQMLTPDGVLADLQRRIDRANQSGAKVLLSIHLNYFYDPSVGGSETFYDSARPYGDRNRELARLVQASVIGTLSARGYATPDRGLTDDQRIDTGGFGTLGNYNHFVLLGPAVAGHLRSSQMPAAVSEPLFISNPPEATAATQGDFQDLLASAYTTALEQFLGVGPQRVAGR